MSTTRIRLEPERWSGQWLAYLEGKSSPIVRLVPGNTRPATRWYFGSVESAYHELRNLIGSDLEVVYRGADGGWKVYP